MKVGEKRNAIMSLSKGRYITFIDDDDWVADDYVAKILEAIEQNPEVITFRVQQTGEDAREHRYYLNNGGLGPRVSQPDRTHYKLSPNHLCVWRKDVVKEDFPLKNKSEDHEWAQMQEVHYSSIHEIPEILYYYRFDKQLTETRK